MSQTSAVRMRSQLRSSAQDHAMHIDTYGFMH